MSGINICLALLIIRTLAKKNNYIQLIVYSLVLSFNYFPVLVAGLVGFDLREIEDGLSKLEYSVFAWNIGFVLQMHMHAILPKKCAESVSGCIQVRTRKLGKPFLLLSVFLSFVIIANNVENLILAMQSGYHSIYTKQTDFVVKTTTIFPFYIWFGAFIISQKNLLHDSDGKLFSLFGCALIAYWVSVVSFLFSGSRSTALYLILVWVFIKYSGKRVALGKLFVSCISCVLIFSVVGLFREGTFDTGGQNVLIRAVTELSQTTIVFVNSIDVMSFDLSRYIRLVGTVVPQFLMNYIGVLPETSLAQQYVELVDPGWAESGGGFGFSVLAEMYIAGGLPFVLVGSMLIASMCSLFNSTFCRRINLSAVSSCSVVSFYVLTLPRGDSYDLYRPIAFSIFMYFLSIMAVNPGCTSGREKDVALSQVRAILDTENCSEMHG